MINEGLGILALDKYFHVKKSFICEAVYIFHTLPNKTRIYDYLIDLFNN